MNHLIVKSAIIAMSLAVLSNTVFAESAAYTDVSNNTNSVTALSKEWTGIYGGLNVDGVFTHAQLDSNQLGFTGLSGVCDTNLNFSSVAPGVQLGYAYQFDSKVVLGAEGDFTYNLNGQANTACICPFDPAVSDKFIIKNRQQGSLRARIGYALPRYLLPFITAGASLATLGVNYYDEYGDSYSQSTSQFGWLVGAGLEWGFLHNWSVRVEYFYVSYGNALNMSIPSVYGLSDPNGSARVNLRTNNARLAVNYWF